MESEDSLKTIAEKIHDEYKIPVQNINKAVAVKMYLNTVIRLKSEENHKEALSKLRELVRNPIRFDIEIDFQHWSLLFIICKEFSKVAAFEVAEKLVGDGIESKNDDWVTRGFSFLSDFFSLNEVRGFIPQLLEYASKNNSLNVLHCLDNWLQKVRTGKNHDEKDGFLYKKYYNELFWVRINILENKRDVHSLLGELNHFNPNVYGHKDEIASILSAINSTLKNTSTKTLVENISLTQDTHQGKTETLAVLSLLELIQRKLDEI